MRLIGYRRVSTRNQASSWGAQLCTFERHAAEIGGELVKVCGDFAAPSDTPWTLRPGLREAIEALHAGAADALVVTWLDRLGRFDGLPCSPVLVARDLEVVEQPIVWRHGRPFTIAMAELVDRRAA